MTANMIWLSLASVGFLAVFVIVERLLFHASMRELSAELVDLPPSVPGPGRPSAALVSVVDLFLDPLCQDVQQKPRELGWLATLARHARGNPACLTRQCQRLRRQAERFDALLPTLASVSTLLGLLGTVVSLIQSGSQGLDPGAILAFGLPTTAVGILICIPCTAVYSMLVNRADRFIDQADVVLAAIRLMQDEPEA